MNKPLVVITGASSGIGAATARQFAAAEYPLLVLARRVEMMEAMGLPNTVCIQADVTAPEGVADAIAQASDRFGPPDLVVNNAGVMPLGRIDSQDPAEWQRLFDVNCVGLLNVSQIVLPGMIERRHGTIVNIGSIAGKNLYGDHAAYCGTKWAVHAMTEQMRREVAESNIRVIVMAPGMTETELLEGTSSDDIKEDYTSYKTSIGGALDPNHVASAILSIYELPQEVCVRELVVAPTSQGA